MDKKKPRLYSLDSIRFIAALYVVLYHYCFRGFNKDALSPLQFSPLEGFAKYGYLGVDLFFIISGFVILMSVINSNILSFIASRISRLYPAYWICLLITSLVIGIWGQEKFHYTTLAFLSNITLLNGFFQIDYIDGVYWSLLVELKFYILIGLVLVFKKIKFISTYINVWLICTIFFYFFSKYGEWNLSVTIINYFIIPKWSSYFIAGMLFYLIYKDGNIKKRIPSLILCLVVSLGYSNMKVEQLNLNYNNVFSNYIVNIIITSFYLIFLLISTQKLSFLNKKIFIKFGMLTYPLYLLHQNIGYIIFTYFKNSINKYILLGITLILMFFFAYLISHKIEKKMGSLLKKKSIKILQNNFFKRYIR